MMLMPPTGAVAITQIGPNHQTITVASAARANLQPARFGSPVSPPWAVPSMDSDIGNAELASYNLFLDGDDKLAGYVPQPGDRLVYTASNGATSQNGTYKIVAAPITGGAFGQIYRKLPVCKIKG